jgi:MFS family permease
VRRAIAVTTAVVLVLEALAIALVNWLLGLVARRQQMSLAGTHADALAIGSWVAGGIFALVLIGCAVLVARIALHDRMAGRFGRIVLIVCAVGHGVIGAAVVGLIGWSAFAAMMVILGLLVGTLLLYAPEDQPSPAEATAATEKPDAQGHGHAPPATA